MLYRLSVTNVRDLAGNALAVHDIEQAMFGTSLGVYLERGGPAEAAAVEEHLEWAIGDLGRRPTGFRRRFEPALLGLAAVAHGDRFDDQGRHGPSGGRRFLGWAVGRHWLRRRP